MYPYIFPVLQGKLFLTLVFARFFYCYFFRQLLTDMPIYPMVLHNIQFYTSRFKLEVSHHDVFFQFVNITCKKFKLSK